MRRPQAAAGSVSTFTAICTTWVYVVQSQVYRREASKEYTVHDNHSPTAERDAILVEDAHARPMMASRCWSPVPALNVPTSSPTRMFWSTRRPCRSILRRAQARQEHPHAGSTTVVHPLGAASTGHSTGGRSLERASWRPAASQDPNRRGVYHAEDIGAGSVREGRSASFEACCSG